MQSSLLSNKIKQVVLLAACLIISNIVISQHTNWQKLPFKINSTPRFFYFDSLTDKLIIGGEFNKVDTIANNLFLWDGSKVSFLKDNGFEPWPPLTALRFKGKELYVGGADGLYAYNDTNWIRIDTNGNSSYIETLYEYNNQLLVGGLFGNFQYPKKQYASISKLENDKWVPLYGIDTILHGEPRDISSILSYKNELYAAGNIDLGPMKEIIKWDGAKWTDVGGGIPGNGDEWVNDMVVYKGDLYVAGRFYRANGAIDNHIARWDGTQWKSVGGGVNGQIIYDIQIFNNELWVTGLFDHAGGVPAYNIAKWDGNNWCGFGNYFDNGLSCLGVYKNELYMGGGFWTIDGDSINKIAKWIGGNYTATCGAIDYSGINELSSTDLPLTISPNPCQDKLNIHYEIGSNKSKIIKVSIYNSIGQKIFVTEGKAFKNTFTIDLSSLETGVFLCEVELNGKIVRKKILKY